MTLFRMFATLAFSASVLSACGPQDPGSDVSRQGVKVGGYSDINSNQAFGGVIAGQTVTGLFYVPPPPSSTATGWWVSTDRDPSEDAAATTRPSSCGANETLFTDDV